MSALTLRPVRDEDGALLFTVYSSTRSDEMALLDWSDQQKLHFLMMQHRAQSTDFATRFPNADHHIVEQLASPIGRLWVDRPSHEIRILDITLLPDYRGRGLGTQLLRALMVEAAGQAVPLRDSVFDGNPRAAALYERLGFEQIGANGAYMAMEYRPPTKS